MFEKININSNGLFDLDADIIEEDLKQTIIKCIDTQKKAANREILSFRPQSDALENVSESALNTLLFSKKDIHGIATDSSISNVISFGAQHIENAVNSEDVEKLRCEVDKSITKKLQSLFKGNAELSIVPSGHFWYPAGSFMSWHTNSQVPGWRIYINYAEEKDKSFFRYQHPENKNIVTLTDKKWNIRIFRITKSQPLWHCVYSNTNRFSLGYMVKIKPNSLFSHLKLKIKNFF